MLEYDWREKNLEVDFGDLLPFVALDMVTTP